jgi:hypothetical protein
MSTTEKKKKQKRSQTTEDFSLLCPIENTTHESVDWKRHIILFYNIYIYIRVVFHSSTGI